MAALGTHLVGVICEVNLLLLCPQAEQEISLLPFLKDTSDDPRCDARCRADSKEPFMVDVIVVISCFFRYFFGGKDRQIHLTRFSLASRFLQPCNSMLCC